MSGEDLGSLELMRTDETRHIKDVLRQAGFDQPFAYRYNSAVIRLRVIDPRFEQLAPEKRDAMVEPVLEHLPERTQADILTLLTLAPSELELRPGGRWRAFYANADFEDPLPSSL